MRRNILTCVVIIIFLITGCAVSNAGGQKNWTVSEVQNWYNKNSSSSNCILYRGSDLQTHHFLSRVIDEWVFLTIKKNELSMPDERPYSATSLGKLGYYYVDPNNHFVKTRDYN